MEKIILSICVVLCVVIAYFWGSRIDRSRVQSNSDSVNRIKDGNNQVKQVNNELTRNAETRRDLTEEIKRSAESTGKGIDDALEILKRAKDRNNTK